MQVVACSTSKDPQTRAAPDVKSSVFMEDQWAVHAYVMSHDGKMAVAPLVDGIRLIRGGGKPTDYPLDLNIGQRDYMWHPDCKRIAFWVKDTPKATKPGQIVHPVRALATLDVTRLPTSLPKGDKVPYEVVYWSTETASPYGIEWSPKGDAVFVLATDLDPEDNQMYGILTRVELDSKKSSVIVRIPGSIDFFMPPVSRFERGEGQSSASYQIIFGHSGGLFVIGEKGENLRQLADVPATGLYNVEWNPSPRANQVALFFKTPTVSKNGRKFMGVYLIDLNKVGGADKGAPAPAAPTPEAGEAAPPEPATVVGPGIEELYDGLDIHTLWFSPKGKYVTYSNQRSVWYRQPADRPEAMVRVTIPTLPNGEDPLIKGVSWNDGENKLAITAGNKLYIYELATKELYSVAELGTMDDTFMAEPRWVGELVWVSSFEDANRSGRIKVKDGELKFGHPGHEIDPTGGRGSSSATESQPPAPTTGPKAPSGGVTNPPAGGKPPK